VERSSRHRILFELARIDTSSARNRSSNRCTSSAVAAALTRETVWRAMLRAQSRALSVLTCEERARHWLGYLRYASK
jgi:hypothetical protein